MADVKESALDSPQSPTSIPAQAPKEKHEPGQSWKAGEEHVLPHNRLGIVFFGLMSCTFLAALDQVRGSASLNLASIVKRDSLQTIVATALPTIVAKLGGGKDYSWVGRWGRVHPIANVLHLTCVL